MALFVPENPINSISSPTPKGEGPTPGEFVFVTPSVNTFADVAFVVRILSGNSHSQVLFFSTQGLAYKLKAWKIPKGSLNS